MVVAPSAPTYEADGCSSVLDYMVVHPVLRPLVERPQVLYHLPLSPHRPCVVRVGVAEGCTALVRRACAQLPVEPPFGPRRAPLHWPEAEAVRADAEVACLLAAAAPEEAAAAAQRGWQEWQHRASVELARALDVPPQATRRLGHAGS